MTTAELDIHEDETRQRLKKRKAVRIERYAALVADLALDGFVPNTKQTATLDDLLEALDVTPDKHKQHVLAVKEAKAAEAESAKLPLYAEEMKVIESEWAEVTRRRDEAMKPFEDEFKGLTERHQLARQRHAHAVNQGYVGPQKRHDFPLAFGILPAEPTAKQPEKASVLHREDQADLAQTSTAASIATCIREDPEFEATIGDELRALMLKARERGWCKDLPPQPAKKAKPVPRDKPHIELIAEQNVLGSGRIDHRPFEVKVKEEMDRLQKVKGAASAATVTQEVVYQGR
jgi:hypothetical protein